MAKGGAMFIPTNSFSLLFFTFVPILVKSIKKCERESARRRTHGRTHGQRQTGFFISPMLYAICYGTDNNF